MCELDMDRLDFELDDTKWKEAFSHPGGLVGGCRCMSPTQFLAVRLLLFFAWLGISVWSTVDWLDQWQYKYYWIHLTNWSLGIELVYFGMAAYTTYMAICSCVPDGLGSQTPWFVSFTWLLGSVTPVLCLMVVVLYWTLDYKPGPGKPTAIDLAVHGVNLVLAFVDMLLNRQPYYVEHVYVPFTVSVSYVLFTIAYWWAGGKGKNGVDPYIYEAVDWSNPHETGHLLGLIVFIGVPLLYGALFGIVACRVKARKEASRWQGDRVFLRP